MSEEKQTLSTFVETARDAFESRLVSKDISFDAEAGFATQALLANDYALNIAKANKRSVIDAVTNVAAIGISLNPAKKQAYLVPRKGAICLDISYMGLIDLAVATGSILWAQCVIVYESDEFQLQGVDKQPIHNRNPFAKDKGAIQGAYSCVKTPQGDFLTHAMPIHEIYAIRDRSEAYKSKKSGPWATDEGEMIKKTVIKQAYKYWPKASPQLERAIHHLNTGDEGIDFKTEQRHELSPKESLKTVAQDHLQEMDIEQQDFLRGQAESVKDAFNEGDIEKANFLMYESSLLAEEITALSAMLDSKVRNGIKKYRIENRKVAA